MREGPLRIFVPLAMPSPRGLGGYYGSPCGYIEVANLKEITECPLTVRKEPHAQATQEEQPRTEA